MKNVVNDLLQKEMSRKEFLKTLGLGVVSIAGFSTLIKMLEGKDSRKVSSGYGSSAYGGNKKS